MRREPGYEAMLGMSIALYPGPAQLSVTYSMMENWAGPGNEAKDLPHGETSGHVGFGGYRKEPGGKIVNQNLIAL